MAEFVTLDVRPSDSGGAIGILTLDRPKMNALNRQMQDEIQAVAHEADTRSDIRAVVLWGGPKVFAAGADIKEMNTMTAAEMTERAVALTNAFDAVARIGKPVIAAVTGYALGGGCELALTADFRISADDAKWGQPEILLGIIPGAGGSQRLARLVGPAKAKDLIYTGRFVDAAEALAIGLVDQVVPADQVLDSAIAYAEKFVAGPSLALRAAKAAIDGGLDGDLASGLRLEAYLFASLFGTEDKRIGMASFVENGPGHATFVGG